MALAGSETQRTKDESDDAPAPQVETGQQTEWPVGADMTRRPTEYHAYLLRLWNANPDGLPAWHASLEDPHTGERHGFADLEQLYTFLQERNRWPFQ